MHGASGVSSMNIWVAGAILLFCIAGFRRCFRGTETAMTAASRARMHALEKQGDQRAAIVNRLLAGRDRLIGAMLLGNTLFNIGASALLTTVLVAMVGESGALYATAAMTVLLLVFAEVLPKTVAINYPDQTSLAVSRICSVLRRRCSARSSSRSKRSCAARSTCAACGSTRSTPLLSPQEELKSAVDLMHKEGGVARADRDMFGGLLDLKELTVSDVMVHRTKMVALDADAPIADLVREVVGLALYPRAALARHARTTSSACCTPRICCARMSGRQWRRQPGQARADHGRARGSCRTRPRSRRNCRPSASARPISRWWWTNMATCRAW